MAAIRADNYPIERDVDDLILLRKQELDIIDQLIIREQGRRKRELMRNDAGLFPVAASMRAMSQMLADCRQGDECYGM